MRLFQERPLWAKGLDKRPLPTSNASRSLNSLPERELMPLEVKGDALLWEASNESDRCYVDRWRMRRANLELVAVDTSIRRQCEQF